MPYSKLRTWHVSSDCLQLESELSDQNYALNKGQPTLYWAKAYRAAKALIRNSYPLADVFGQLYIDTCC